MRTILKGCVVALFLTALAGCGAGNGTVYVGVGVAGPWGGYGYPYPGVPGGTFGYPPRYWDDDQDSEQDTEQDRPDGQAEAQEADRAGLTPASPRP